MEAKAYTYETAVTWEHDRKGRLGAAGRPAVVVGAPKIVEIKQMQLEAPFHRFMLFINNSDKPGFIGALGTLLGDAQINIATFHLGREGAGAEAIALVGVDQPLPEPVMEKLKALPQVRYAKLLRF